MKTYTKYTLTVGTQKAITEKGMGFVMSCRESWAERLVRHFGGVTVNKTRGGYMMDDGNLVFEDVYVYEVIEMGCKGEGVFINALAAEMANKFGEECVLVTESEINAELVRGVSCH